MITIVSGLPRSGTSMMMHMLDAGGMKVETDNLRLEDSHNPNGYREISGIVKKVMDDPYYLTQFDGSVVKLTANGIAYLREYTMPVYRIIYMERDLNEVYASQQVMLGESLDVDPEIMTYLERMDYSARRAMEAREDIEFIIVNYNSLISDPDEGLLALIDFIGLGVDPEKMLTVIDKKLYRNRRAEKEKMEKRMRALGYLD